MGSQSALPVSHPTPPLDGTVFGSSGNAPASTCKYVRCNESFIYWPPEWHRQHSDALPRKRMRLPSLHLPDAASQSRSSALIPSLAPFRVKLLPGSCSTAVNSALRTGTITRPSPLTLCVRVSKLHNAITSTLQKSLTIRLQRNPTKYDTSYRDRNDLT